MLGFDGVTMVTATAALGMAAATPHCAKRRRSNSEQPDPLGPISLGAIGPSVGRPKTPSRGMHSAMVLPLIWHVIARHGW